MTREEIDIAAALAFAEHTCATALAVIVAMDGKPYTREVADETMRISLDGLRENFAIEARYREAVAAVAPAPTTRTP